MPRNIIKTPGQVDRSSDATAVNHRQVHAALLALANPNKAAFRRGSSKLERVNTPKKIVSLALRFRPFDNLPENSGSLV